MNDKLNLLYEVAQWLAPATLATMIAELNSGDDVLTRNMDMAIGVFTEQLEALVGSDAGAMIYDASVELG